MNGKHKKKLRLVHNKSASHKEHEKDSNKTKLREKWQCDNVPMISTHIQIHLHRYTLTGIS